MKRYFRHKIENLIVVTRIVTVHPFEFAKDFRTKGESHDFWELVYANRSDILCYADGAEIPLRQGEALFHKPGEFHALSANGKTPPAVIIVSFACASEAMRFFEGRKVRLTRRQTGLLYALLEEAEKTFDLRFPDPDAKKIDQRPSPTLGGLQLVKNYLEILLVDAMRSLTETESGNEIFLKKGEFNSKLVSEVIAYLEANLHASPSIGDVCRAVRYSKTYLFREFRAETGKSVMEYFSEMKVERAKKMLRESDISVRALSEALAYDTPNYFSKSFKKSTGLTPSDYRKRTKR